MRNISKKIVLTIIAAISIFSAHAQTKAVIEIDSVAGHIFIH
jgi:hypothetical protein